MTALLFLFGLLGAAFWFVMGNSNGNLNEENKGVLETTTPVKTQSRAKPYLTITPKMVRQGDPALITAEGATTTRDVKSFTFDDRPLFIFLHEGQVSALLGVELRAVPDTYPIILTFNDGRQIKENELQHPVLVVTGDLPAMGWEPARLVEAINKLPVDLVILDLAAGWFSDNLRASPYVLGMVDAMVSEARGEWSLFWLGNESRNLGVLMRTKASGGGEG